MQAEPANILADYLTQEDLAESTRVSPRTIARYRHQANGLPYLRWGGRIYIHRTDALAWMQARMVRPNVRRSA